MAKYLVTDIDWDVDDEQLEETGELPQELEVEINDYEIEDLTDDSEVGDILADRISDIVGFCHDGFDWQRVDDDGIHTHFEE